MTKVFINPGHSLNCKPDPGAINKEYKEAMIAATLAEKLAKLLKQSNIESEIYQQTGFLNVTNSANKQLNEVARVANKSNADIFVSIHLNSAADKTASGTETLHSGCSTNGKRLATFVNSKLALAFDNYTFKNRGAKPDTRGLLVLKATTMPAVLIEVGFISNDKEINFILNNQDVIARRIYEAICMYFNKEAISDTAKTEEHFEIKLTKDSNGLYNCLVNDELKLKANKLQSCLSWVKEKYAN